MLRTSKFFRTLDPRPLWDRYRPLLTPWARAARALTHRNGPPYRQQPPLLLEPLEVRLGPGNAIDLFSGAMAAGLTAAPLWTFLTGIDLAVLPASRAANEKRVSPSGALSIPAPRDELRDSRGLLWVGYVTANGYGPQTSMSVAAPVEQGRALSTHPRQIVEADILDDLLGLVPDNVRGLSGRALELRTAASGGLLSAAPLLAPGGESLPPTPGVVLPPPREPGAIAPLRLAPGNDVELAPFIQLRGGGGDGPGGASGGATVVSIQATDAIASEPGTDV